MSNLFGNDTDMAYKICLKGIHNIIDFSAARRSGHEGFLFSFSVLDFDESTIAVIQTRNMPAQFDACNACNKAKVLAIVRDIPNEFVKHATIIALQHIVDKANDKSISYYNNNKENCK